MRYGPYGTRPPREVRNLWLLLRSIHSLLDEEEALGRIVEVAFGPPPPGLAPGHDRIPLWKLKTHRFPVVRSFRL